MKWQTLLISAIAGALIWALSPWLAGQREPWDAEGFYYVSALLVAGLAAGLLAPRPFWAHYLGGLIGQAVYVLLINGPDPLLAVGMIFLLLYTLILLVGAVIAAQVRGLIQRRPVQE